jgi:hypothetical protein
VGTSDNASFDPEKFPDPGVNWGIGYAVSLGIDIYMRVRVWRDLLRKGWHCHALAVHQGEAVSRRWSLGLIPPVMDKCSKIGKEIKTGSIRWRSLEMFERCTVLSPSCPSWLAALSLDVQIFVDLLRQHHGMVYS